MARALEAQFASHIADQQAALYQKAQGQLQHMQSERNTWENMLESEYCDHILFASVPFFNRKWCGKQHNFYAFNFNVEFRIQ